MNNGGFKTMNKGFSPRSSLVMRAGVPDEISVENPLKIAIAGGGVGGLIAAIALEKKGFDVTVYERTGEFKKFGGPIQLASNALSTLRADEDLFDRIMEKFTFTGVRTCGIKDGLRTEWYTKFTAIKDCADAGNLAYTGVINRPDLQAICLDMLGGKKTVKNEKMITKYEKLPEGGVKVYFEDGTTDEADVCIGADGIWSTVRAQMWNENVKGEGAGATYSGYTVFAGETTYQTADYWETGYKVYIGPGQYFVTSDVGEGRMQWYAFLALPAGSKAREDNVQYIKDRFEGWSPEIHELLDITKVEDVEQRDLYDRPPSVLKRWNDGPVALLGDACHPMMPNLGQGGCQAMEDCYVIANKLSDIKKRSQVNGALSSYYDSRILRSAAVQGLSRFASDIIIQNFDVPLKIETEPSFKVDCPSYKSVFTAFLQPFMPLIFLAQFAYLYSFAPTRLTPEFKENLVATERVRARKLSEAAWAKANAIRAKEAKGGQQKKQGNIFEQLFAFQK